MRAFFSTLLLLIAAVFANPTQVGVGAHASEARAATWQECAPAGLAPVDQGRFEARLREANCGGGSSAAGGGAKPSIVHSSDRARAWRSRAVALLCAFRDADASNAVLALRFLRVNGSANGHGART